jgi:hypothetical protein
MIELDTAPLGLTQLNIAKMEHALREVQEGIQHFIDRSALGDHSINWIALDRLRIHHQQTKSELEAFKKSHGQKG